MLSSQKQSKTIFKKLRKQIQYHDVYSTDFFLDPLDIRILSNRKAKQLFTSREGYVLRPNCIKPENINGPVSILQYWRGV